MAEDFKKDCQHCNGTGKIYDDFTIGQEMRRLRTSAKVTLRQIANKLNLSAAYLSDLENGKRRWNAFKIERYQAALGVMVVSGSMPNKHSEWRVTYQHKDTGNVFTKLVPAYETIPKIKRRFIVQVEKV